MKTMKKNSFLKVTCPDMKLTNHSDRKTVVKKLKSSGVPKCELKNITGHSSKLSKVRMTTTPEMKGGGVCTQAREGVSC